MDFLGPCTTIESREGATGLSGGLGFGRHREVIAALVMGETYVYGQTLACNS